MDNNQSTTKREPLINGKSMVCGLNVSDFKFKYTELTRDLFQHQQKRDHQQHQNNILKVTRMYENDKKYTTATLFFENTDKGLQMLLPITGQSDIR